MVRVPVPDGGLMPSRENRFVKVKHLASEDLACFKDIIPGEEPPLSPCGNGPRRGKIYPVAVTFLVGKERAYLNQCIDSNWISSKGPFVEKFERAFAHEV